MTINLGHWKFISFLEQVQRQACQKLGEVYSFGKRPESTACAKCAQDSEQGKIDRSV